MYSPRQEELRKITRKAKALSQENVKLKQQQLEATTRAEAEEPAGARSEAASVASPGSPSRITLRINLNGIASAQGTPRKIGPPASPLRSARCESPSFFSIPFGFGPCRGQTWPPAPHLRRSGAAGEDEVDLMRIQVEALLQEKAGLQQDNGRLRMENAQLQELLMYAMLEAANGGNGTEDEGVRA